MNLSYAIQSRRTLLVSSSPKLSLRRLYHSPKHIHPFSASIPSPGHQWCELCQIQCHKFEKPIGVHNTCHDVVAYQSKHRSLIRMCPAAKHYYQQQFSYMIFLGLLSFVVLPGVTFDFTNESDNTILVSSPPENVAPSR